MVADEKLELELVADADDATDVLDDFRDDADRLVDRFPVVEVEADAGGALDALDDVRAAADDVDQLDPTVTPDVDARPALDQLARVEDAAGKAGAAGGSKFGAGFIRDVGGAIDQGVAGPVGDLVEAFEVGTQTLGDTLPVSILQPLTAAVGAAGFAYIAAQAFWKFYQQEASAAAARVKEVQDAQTALADQDYTAAAQKLIKTYGSLIKTVDEYGVTGVEAADAISGKNDVAIQKLEEQRNAITGNTDDVTRYGDASAFAIQLAIDRLKISRGEWDKSADSLATNNELVEDIASSLETFPTSKTVDLRLNDDEARAQLNFWKNLTPIRTFVKGPTLSTPTAAANSARSYEARNGPVSVAP